jgi:hypothetical protein
MRFSMSKYAKNVRWSSCCRVQLQRQVDFHQALHTSAVAEHRAVTLVLRLTNPSAADNGLPTGCACPCTRGAPLQLRDGELSRPWRRLSRGVASTNCAKVLHPTGFRQESRVSAAAHGVRASGGCRRCRQRAASKHFVSRCASPSATLPRVPRVSTAAASQQGASAAPGPYHTCMCCAEAVSEIKRIATPDRPEQCAPMRTVSARSARKGSACARPSTQACQAESLFQSARAA